MTVIGITGVIGSGKSTCARALGETEGAVVIDADKLGHEAYAQGSSLIPKLVDTFGPSILRNEEIDRSALGRIVFEDPVKLKQLTDLVWPEIRRLAENIIQNVQSQSVIIIEAAVLLEAGWTSLVDYVILLHVSDKSELIRRLSIRDPQLTTADVLRRLSVQSSFDQRLEILKKANVPYSVVNADCPKNELLDHVRQLVDDQKSRKIKSENSTEELNRKGEII